jgi:hypothetical protein
MASFASHNSSAVLTSTSTSSEALNDYDYEGAAIYIAMILIWYSAGLVLMLFFRVRPRTFESRFLFDYETSGKSASSNANPFARYHDIQADNTKKQILHELKDIANRQRLWKIYYSSAEKQDEPHAQYYQTITADNVTIGRINRKLADIDRLGAEKDAHKDGDLLPTMADHSSSDNRFETTKFFSKRFTSRRPSGGALHSRRPILRVPSQPLTATTPSTAHKELPADGKQGIALPGNGSSASTNTQLVRFTVEKVPNNSRKRSEAAENPW